MDYGQENIYSGGSAVQVLSGNSGNDVTENWGIGPVDPAVWATEDDYQQWNRESSVDPSFNSSYDGRQSGNEPQSKRSRNAHSGSKLIGKMFYKTKLCCKFRMGTCPYITNCNFAHSNEELRKPPHNWQEIVAAHEDDRVGLDEPREEFQIPILGVSEDTQRSYKGRHCKKFYTEEGCPYGDSCTFLHDEQSKARESVVISLGPGSGSGGGGSGGGGGGYGNNGNASNLKPSNWKTRICNKWELTGYCPFGSKCHFAHGVEELHSYGGGPVETEGRDSSALDPKPGVIPSKTSADNIVPSVTLVPHSDNYNVGVPTQRLSNVIKKTEPRVHQKWKGPDKINKIYGDWIDDFE